jgi:hypothetical protein
MVEKTFNEAGVEPSRLPLALVHAAKIADRKTEVFSSEENKIVFRPTAAAPDADSAPMIDLPSMIYARNAG